MSEGDLCSCGLDSVVIAFASLSIEKAVRTRVRLDNSDKLEVHLKSLHNTVAINLLSTDRFIIVHYISHLHRNPFIKAPGTMSSSGVS